MVTDITENQGERHFFSYHRRGSRRILFANKTNVSRDINFRRTGKTAGNKRRPTALAFTKLFFVHDGTGGTHFSTGPAEPASGLGKGDVFSSTYICLPALLVINQDTDTTQLATCPDTAAAKNALIWIVKKKGIRG